MTHYSDSGLRKIRKGKEAINVKTTPAPSKEEVLLSEIRDLLKEQNNRS
jgi:large conductance mechanosensitive channel